MKFFNKFFFIFILSSNSQLNTASHLNNSFISNNSHSSNNINNAFINNTSPLTSSQLATLLPILNIPILSQLINSAKPSTESQQQQQQSYLKTSVTEPLNLTSTLNKSLNRASTNRGVTDENSNSTSANQPLNLCKENTQQNKISLHGKKSSVMSSSSKPTTSPPPPPLYQSNIDKNAATLSVNVNSSLSSPLANPNGNALSSNLANNLLTTSIFNASPSPSVSSSSSSSASVTSSCSNSISKSQANQEQPSQSADSLHKLQQQLSQHTNEHKHFTHLPQTKSSFANSNRRQRERTTFDPQEEITRLMQIFERTHHPTRYQIASICDSLNSLACRVDKKPLEPYNIQYWFKNARAALRRKVKEEVSGPTEKSSININSGDYQLLKFD